MRFLHSADWHLGRLLHARSLIEDQQHLLAQICARVREIRPDALLIAGDVYDRAVPAPEAVALLDDFLEQVVLGLRVPVMLIAGNHDSGQRLGFASRLLSGAGLHIAGRLDATPQGIALHDADGEVWVYLLPYADPAEVRSVFGVETPLSHGTAMQRALDAIRAVHPAGARAVLVAHAFVAGGEESESERPLSVGGSAAVDAGLFHGFDYAALGHLHRPQTLGGGRLRYAGSPLKYSLSEVGQAKSLTLVELAADRGHPPRLEVVPLTPLRDLHLLSGSLAEVCAPQPGLAREDYVIARVNDRGALFEPMARLRAAWPNALALQREVLLGVGAAAVPGARRAATTPDALFADFFAEVTGSAPAADERAALAETLQRLLAAEVPFTGGDEAGGGEAGGGRT